MRRKWTRVRRSGEYTGKTYATRYKLPLQKTASYGKPITMGYWHTMGRGRRSTSETTSMVGPWAWSKNTEMGDGGRPRCFCAKYQLCGTNTIRPHERATLTTIYHGQVGRDTTKLDYKMITHEQRQCVKQANVKGIVNTNHPHKHRIAIRDIRFRIQEIRKEDRENTLSITYANSDAIAVTYNEK